MRLREIDRGDGVFYRLLIGCISFVSRMRLPDAARVAFYHKDFFGGPMGAWTHAAMRGPGTWSIGERELMAALVAKWNSCAFCVGAHGAVAAKKMQRPMLDAALADFRTAAISEGLKATLAFLEIMTLRPMQLTGENAKNVLDAGVRARGETIESAAAAWYSPVSWPAQAGHPRLCCWQQEKVVGGRPAPAMTREVAVRPVEALISPQALSADGLTDAIAVGALFGIVTRYANALDFTLPTARDFDRAASMLLKRGYKS